VRDSEYRDLSLKMRTFVTKVIDARKAGDPTVVAKIDGDSRVIAARAAAAVVDEAAAKRNATRASIEAQLQRLESKITDLTERRRAIDAARPALALAIFEETASDDVDRDAQLERADWQRQLEQSEVLKTNFSSALQMAIAECSRESHASTRGRASDDLETALGAAEYTIACDMANA